MSPRTAVVVMGVAGCGKSTVAALLADRLGWPLGEADDLHPTANVAKMSAGNPLTDEDRGPWLERVRGWIEAQDGDSVLTCSALRRRYRDVLRTSGARVRFVHLTGTRELLTSRLAGRTEHFMPPALLDSQLATLEPLAIDEDGIEVGLGVGIGRTPDVLVEEILVELGLGVRAG